MKKRYMEPKNHKSIDKYKFKKIYVNSREFNGYVGFINIRHVTNVWHVPRKNGKKECILNSGYNWIVFYPENEKYAITVLCNNKKEVVEWYFDMVKSFGIEDGMPYMYDLYLDLVITRKGEVYILDEDELLEAVKINDITEEDYKMAHDTLDMLLKKYDNGNNIDDLIDLTDKYIGEL